MVEMEAWILDGKIYHACKEKKYDVIVVGIPKTIDNDLAITDHSPVLEVLQDILQEQ